MMLYSLVSLADSCTVVVSRINRFKTACGEFRTNGKVDISIVHRRRNDDKKKT